MTGQSRGSSNAKCRGECLAAGEGLLTHEEAEQAREEDERARDEEAVTRRAAEARAAKLEARLRTLEGTPEPPDVP